MCPSNEILVHAACLACGEETTLRCVAEVAASEHGDASGPFSGRVYRLGERMAWWPRDCAWRFEGVPNQPPGQALEVCPATCEHCAAALEVVIRYRELVPNEVVEVRVPWPLGPVGRGVTLP
jgi:hypothetical protein